MRLPTYVPRGARSGKSQQLWIARHRRLPRELKRNRAMTDGHPCGLRTAAGARQSMVRFTAGPRRGVALQGARTADVGIGRLNRWRTRLARHQGEQVISHESIYLFVYAQDSADEGLFVAQALATGKWRRGRRRRGGAVRLAPILHRRTLNGAPGSRCGLGSEFGHWEVDGMHVRHAPTNGVDAARASLAAADWGAAAFERSRAGLPMP